MDSIDLQVLQNALQWRREGRDVTLVTVIETWGSAPRPPGALLVVRDDGVVVGSVSGGCVEDDLIARVRDRRQRITRPEWLTYGVSKEEATRFGLPCGGTLKLLQEPLIDVQWIEELLARVKRHQLIARSLDITSGRVTLQPATRGQTLSFNGTQVTTVYGPRLRLLIIGAGQLSRYLAQMAQAVDYQVLVCDPREEYLASWDVPEVVILRGMPDDVILAANLDAQSAVVALTHDPKLDDLALLEALKSPAFYVGALGSRANTAKRKKRLREFDLSETEIDRLHGPIGLHIGSRTPPEIAIAILAEMIAVKNNVPITQRKLENHSCITHS